MSTHRIKPSDLINVAVLMSEWSRWILSSVQCGGELFINKWMCEVTSPIIAGMEALIAAYTSLIDIHILPV